MITIGVPYTRYINIRPVHFTLSHHHINFCTGRDLEAGSSRMDIQGYLSFGVKWRCSHSLSSLFCLLPARFALGPFFFLPTLS
jgi:hypothetical protein